MTFTAPHLPNMALNYSVLFKHLMLLTRFSDIYDFLKRWFVVLVSQNTVNLCTTVTLGKWQGDCYIQGDRYIQVNISENIKETEKLFNERNIQGDRYLQARYIQV